MKKGEKTKNIKFVKLDDKYTNETLLCNVSADKIKEKNNSLNYKLYIETKNQYQNIENKKISDIFDIIKSKKQVLKVVPWEYKFVSMADNKTSNEYTCEGKNIVISNVGPVGKIYYYEGKCDFASILNKLEL